MQVYRRLAPRWLSPDKKMPGHRWSGHKPHNANVSGRHRLRAGRIGRHPGSHALGIGAEGPRCLEQEQRSEEHTSELQSLMRISYAVFCLKKKTSIKQKK